MSSTLYWNPVTPNKGHAVGTGLKLLLRDAFGFPVDIKLGKGDVAFLRGVAVGCSDEAKQDVQALLSAIEMHGEIELHEGDW